MPHEICQNFTKQEPSKSNYMSIWAGQQRRADGEGRREDEHQKRAQVKGCKSQIKEGRHKLNSRWPLVPRRGRGKYTNQNQSAPKRGVTDRRASQNSQSPKKGTSKMETNKRGRIKFQSRRRGHSRATQTK